MKQKKRLEISRFDIQNNQEKVCFEKFYNYLPTNVLANKTATSCFGFLRWFLRKFMGYDV